MNILFTCAGRRNYLINYFKEELRGLGLVYAADMQLSAPALADADKAIVVPAVNDEAYIPGLLDICKKNNIHGLISLNDLELPLLSENLHLFEKIGTKVIISSSKVIKICFDKLETVDFCKSIGINTPLTFSGLDEAIEALKNGQLTFPVVIKPRWGSASIGIEFPETLEELQLSYKLLNVKIKRSILADASMQDIDRSILIQEKIKGEEFGLDILNDFSGRTVAVYVKEKLAMRAGETDKAILRNLPELDALGFQLGNALGHIGNLDCDFFEKDGEYYLLEMNPRFGGGYPFTQMSGGNYPSAIISWLEGKEFDFSTFNKEYNQPYAKCDRLIRVLK